MEYSTTMRILEDGSSTDAFAKKQITKTPNALIAICCSILSLTSQARRPNSNRQNTMTMSTPCFRVHLVVRFFLHPQRIQKHLQYCGMSFCSTQRHQIVQAAHYPNHDA